MAYNRKPAEAQHGRALVVMALILFTATADTQLLPPILTPIIGGLAPPIGGLLNLTGLNVGGALCCTPNGNCLLGSPGVPGVVVGLNCTNLAGVSVQVGQGSTNVNGIFNISVPNLLQTLGNVLTLNGTVLPCRVSIPLPINTTVCQILNAIEGVLTGVPFSQGLPRLLSTNPVGSWPYAVQFRYPDR